MTVVAVAVTGPVHEIPRYPTPLADLAAATTAATRWLLPHNKPHLQVSAWATGSTSASALSVLEACRSGSAMAQLAQLNGMNGMNPFNMNMLGMANLSAMGISPEAQLLAAQIAAAGGGFGQPGLGLGGGLGGFAGIQRAAWVVLGAADWVGPEAARRASALTARAAHRHPQEETTTAAVVRRKTKKISTLQY